MSVSAKIKRLVTRRLRPKRVQNRRHAKELEDRMGGGSPHDLGEYRYLGSFRDE